MWHCAWCWGRVRISPLKITIKDLNWVRDKTCALEGPFKLEESGKGSQSRALSYVLSQSPRAGLKVICLTLMIWRRRTM